MLGSVLSIVFVGVCIKSTMGTVPTASSWFKYTFWTDILCTKYAGEYSMGLNECYLTSYGHAKYSAKILSAATLEVDSHFYSDSSCTSSSFNTTQYYSYSCADAGLGYYYSTSIVNAPSTSFAGSGILTTVYDTTGDCGNNVGEMAYQFQVYNTSICYPWLNNAYLTAVSCETGYTSKSNETCAVPGYHTVTSPSYGCTSVNEITTIGEIIGSAEGTCIGIPTVAPTFVSGTSAMPSYSRNPTRAPTVMPTLGPSTYWLQYTYWMDSACTQWAGVQGGLGNTCLRTYNGEYSNATIVSEANGVYTIHTNIYYNSQCSGSPAYFYTEAYNSFCTYDVDHYYTTTIVSSIPDSFPSEGALTKLYATNYDCTINSGAVWYMYQVYGVNICYEYLNNEYTNTDECGVYNICSTDDSFSVTVNSCPTTTSYASSTSSIGYAYTSCVSSDSNDDDSSSKLSPGTIAAIVVPVTVVLLVAAAGLYYFFVVMPASSLTAPLMTSAAANTA